MDSLVAAWRQRVPADANNLAVLTNAIAARNLEVETWIETHLKSAIAMGIDSCVARASDSLALPVPSAYVSVPAFTTYLRSLASAGLTVDVATNAQGPETSLLLLNPGH